MTQPSSPGEFEEAPPSTDPAPRLSCPRCGGAGVPRKVGRRSNPFLCAPTTRNQLTCVDCGLDFEAGPDTEARSS